MLDDVRVRYKGRDFVADPYDFFLQQRPDVVKTLAMGVDKLMPGRLVPAGEWIQTMGADGDGHESLLPELLRLFVVAEVPKAWLAPLGADGPASEKAVVIVTYSSVYGEQWSRGPAREISRSLDGPERDGDVGRSGDTRTDDEPGTRNQGPSATSIRKAR